MNFFAIASALLKLVVFFVERAQKAGALDEAKRLILADQMIELSKKGEVLDEVRARVAAMSDDAVDKRLSERGDYRD